MLSQFSLSRVKIRHFLKNCIEKRNSNVCDGRRRMEQENNQNSLFWLKMPTKKASNNTQQEVVFVNGKQ